MCFLGNYFLRCHQGGRSELESRGGAKGGVGGKVRDRSLKRLSVGADCRVNAGDK